MAGLLRQRSHTFVYGSYRILHWSVALSTDLSLPRQPQPSRRILVINIYFLILGSAGCTLLFSPFIAIRTPLQPSSRVCDRPSSNKRCFRGHCLPPNPPVPHARRRLPLVHKTNWPLLAGLVLDADAGRYRGFVGVCYAGGLLAFLVVTIIATEWRY
jgi:hypothetical protein